MGQIQQNAITQLRSLLGDVMTTVRAVETFNEVASARNWGSWQDADFSDVIVNGQPLTRAEALAMFQALTDLNTFMRGGTVTATDRRPIFNKFRADI